MTTTTPVLDRQMNGGRQQIFRFPNGYGASVIRGGQFAYGGLELAVLRYYGEGVEDCGLTYDTPITNDVLGYLDESDVPDLLARIAALPRAGA